MASPGTPWTVSEEHIADVLKKHQGVIAQAAKELQVRRETLSRRCSAIPWLKELLVELRNELVETKLDTAEDTVDWTMSLREKDVSNTLRAAIYTLNNLGKRRNYAHPEAAAFEAKCMYDLAMKAGVGIKEADEPNDQPKTI